MTKLDIKDYEKIITEALEKVGTKGLTKSQLKIKAKTAKENALNNLIKNREVGNLGTQKNNRFVLMKYYKPLEIAYEHIKNIAQTGKLDIFTKSTFLKGLQGAVRAKMDEALDFQVKEGKLLKLRHGTNRFFYLHAAAVKDQLPEAPAAASVSEAVDSTPPPSVSSEEFENRVMAAYLELKLSGGFSDVEIYSLQQKAGVDMDALKEFLLEKSRQGRAVLSGGDWSMSSEGVRSGAIYLRGRPHLMVRFKTEG